MPLIIKKLSLRRGSRLLIKDLSISLDKGQSLLLTGPNGVGKTTLIRAIAGFIPPHSGQITYLSTPQPAADFKNNNGASPPEPELIHYIGHKNGLRTSLTVLENLEFWQGFYGAANSNTKTNSAETELREVMKTFSLTTLMDIPAGYLSAGQKRRLGLARLLLSKRPLWLLDEPTVSLDRLSAELLAKTAEEHLKQGGILIAATHIPLGIPFTKEIELSPNYEPAYADQI